MVTPLLSLFGIRTHIAVFFLLAIYILAVKLNPFSMELSLWKSLFGDWLVVIK